MNEHLQDRGRDLAGVNGATWSLRLGVAVQSAALVWLAFRHGTSLDAVLFMQLGTSEATATLADRALAVVVSAGALALLARSSGAAAVTVGVAFLVHAMATRVAGGRAFAELSPAAHATRWLAPAAVAVLWSRLPAGARPSRRRIAAAGWVLRLAVASTFAVHGWEALRHHPAFVDLLLGSARRWTGGAPAEASAHVLLNVIGAVDVGVALLLLLRHWPWLAFWATVWGLTTAASRTLALGPEFLHESLLRTMNAAAPLALWLLWRPARARSSDAPPL